MIQELTAGIPYTVDTGEKLVNETFGPNNIRRRKTGSHELMTMAVRNGRLLAGEISLERNGFVLVEHKTKVGDFFDTQQLESVYYREVEQLIKRESGASREKNTSDDWGCISSDKFARPGAGSAARRRPDLP